MDFINLVEKMKEWVQLRVSPHYPAYPSLVYEVRQSFREWQQAKTSFNFAPSEFIDYTIYRLNAAEKHYTALLTMAKKQGVKAWPDDLAEPVRNLNLDPEEIDAPAPRFRFKNFFRC